MFTEIPESARQRSLTIYLDQAQLSNLAHGRELAKAKFEQLCSDCKLIPVFSMAHIYETSKHADKNTRQRIAIYADSLPKRRWILSRHVLVAEEGKRAFLTLHGFDCPPLDPLRDELKHVLYAGAQEPIEIILEDYGFLKTLKYIESEPELSQGFDEWKAFEASFPSAKGLLAAAVSARGSTNVLRDLDKRFREDMAEKIPDRFPDSNFVTPQHRRKFQDDGPWSTYDAWPTTYLYIQVEKEITRDISARVDPSHLTDQVHLSALPYVDLFLCDGQTRDYIRRARVPDAVLKRCFTKLGVALAGL
jgi:hypothetical protein